MGGRTACKATKKQYNRCLKVILLCEWEDLTTQFDNDDCLSDRL